MNRLFLFLLCGVILFTISALASAQAIPTVAGEPQLYVRRGETLDVTLRGGHLAEVTSLALPRARGLTISLREPAQATAADAKPTAKDKAAKPAANILQLHLEAAADAVLGDRELRLISPRGASAPLHVTVGQYPLITEKEPNNTDDDAQDISFPATLTGRIDSAGDIDCFRFSATKSQKLVFDVYANRAHSQLDPVILVRDVTGHEQALDVDLHGSDPTAIFDVPADGKYVLAIRDLQYRGGQGFSYRIDAGAIPYIRSILPQSAEPGRVAELKPIGVNLTGAEAFPLDLTYAAEGDVSIRASASGGVSNGIQLSVSDIAAHVDEKPSHSAATAHAVSLPSEISGRIEQSGEENFYAFHLARRMPVLIEAVGRKSGSALNALLTLRNSAGALIARIDEVNAAAARFSREFDPGDYVVAITDMFDGGGPTYSYRLLLRTDAVAGAQEGDFSARFLPDAPRIWRGGTALLYIDLDRIGGFKGDVTATAEDLPPGVSASPVVINDKLPGASGVLLLSAGPNAPTGTFPLHVRVSASIGSTVVTHDAVAMLSARPVESAYLTVLDASPIAIDTEAAVAAPRLRQLAAEADALAQRLSQPDPQIADRQAQWEKQNADPIKWSMLKDATIDTVAHAKFEIQGDGSFLAKTPNPSRDTYTITGTVDATGITAFRLEAIPDDSLPSHGPGRSGDGNFVLSQITAAVGPKGDPSKAKPITFRDARADLEQENFGVLNAIQPKLGRGWAMSPYAGKPNRAVFYPAEPVTISKDSVLTISLDQQFGETYVLGRFRLSVTDDPQAVLKATIPTVIAKLLAEPADKRPPEAKAQLAEYYRSIDPVRANGAARLAAIRSILSQSGEIPRLQAMIDADNSELDVRRSRWEKSVLAGSAWLPVTIASAKSQNGARLTRQPDGSVLASGAAPANDVYTLSVTSPVRHITALRIEALPDPSLPGNGPGRSANGNFVLSRISVIPSLPPSKTPEMEGPAPAPVEFRAARASVEQDGYPAASMLLDRKDAGWGVMPFTARPATATFYAAQAFGADGPITIVLEHNLSIPQHTLGRFRIWATGASEPDLAAVIPTPILAIVKASPAKRSPPQKEELAAYYRDISPAMQPIRDRLAELTAESNAQWTFARGRRFAVPFLLSRGGFDGAVKISIEGFVAGRDPNSAAPLPIATTLKADPLTVDGGKPTGKLEVEVERATGAAARYVVLKAEAAVGDDVVTTYSEPFAVTVTER